MFISFKCGKRKKERKKKRGVETFFCYFKVFIHMLAVADENKLESRICLLYAAPFLTPANRETVSYFGLTRAILFLDRKRVSLFTT